MAMAPKKKFDFFNGGRGVNLNIYMDEERKSPPPPLPTPPPSCSSNSFEREEMPIDTWNRYGVAESYACSSPPPLQQVVYPHHEYLPEYSDATLSGSQSPTGYSEHSQGGHYSPNSYAPPSPVGMGGISHAQVFHDATISQDSMQPWGSINEEEEIRRKKKRHQRCRLCANHNVYVEVKGHKWYCPYREPHNCEKCDITRKRQYYMAEQQKLTREQQHQLQAQHNRYNNNRGLCSSVGLMPPNCVVDVPQAATPSSNSEPPLTPFPRLDELVRETANIISEELFEEINQVVRPKAKQ